MLSRGLIGSVTGDFSDGFRAHAPRFQGEALKANLALVAALNEIARGMGVNVAVLAAAWALSRGDDIVPLAGARTRTQLADFIAATELVLSPGNLARIEAAIPVGAVVGDRYPAFQMGTLDSERRVAP